MGRDSIGLKRGGALSFKRRNERENVNYELATNFLLDGISEWIVVSDEDYDIIYMNKAARREYGDGVGKKCYRVFQNFDVPCYLKGIPCNHHEIFDKGKNDNVYVSRDPKGGWIEVHGTLMRAGRRFLVEIVHDITDRKRMEELLERSEAKYSALVENSKDGIAVVQDGVLKFVNKSSIGLGGYPPEKMVGRDFLDFVAPEYRELVLKRYADRMAGKKVPSIYEVEFLRKDGSKLPVEINASRIDFEGEPADLVFIRDVAERKQAERVLRESEEKLRSIFASSPNAIGVSDLTGRLIECNQATLDLHKYESKDELVGKNAFELIAKKDHVKIIENMKKAMDEGTVKDIEYTLLTKNGVESPAELSASVLRDAAGKPSGFIVIARDITERKRMENLSKLRNKLKKMPDVSSGLSLILDTALNDFGMDVGAVLLIKHSTKTVTPRCYRSRIEGFEMDETYPLDGGFAELKVLRRKEVSRIVGKDEASILKANSIHCTPIYLENKVYGILAFGSRKEAVLDKRGLSALNLLSELTSTLFGIQRLKVTPVKEKAVISKRRVKLEYGELYLIKNNVEGVYEIFVDNVLSGLEGLCITREYPPKIRRRYGLKKTPIIWLTEEKTEKHETVYSLQDLSILIKQFLNNGKHRIVLLEGFEYLITHHNFDSFIHFLQLARSRFEQTDSILIAPLLEKALDVKKVKLIEKEMKPVRTEKTLKLGNFRIQYSQKHR